MTPTTPHPDPALAGKLAEKLASGVSVGAGVRADWADGVPESLKTGKKNG